jgi:hypothetical protein
MDKEKTSTIYQNEEPQEEQTEVSIPLTLKELKSLHRNKYEQVREKFKKAFVIRNKKTNQIVELVAASSTHACSLIGWRPRSVQVLEVKDKEDGKETK